MIGDDELKELHDIFGEMSPSGKSLTTVMMAWTLLTDKDCGLSRDDKDRIMLENLKLLRLSTVWFALKFAVRAHREDEDGFQERMELEINIIIDEVKTILNKSLMKGTIQ